ncbi:hypothetical protein [Fimbriiglobus ruber]|uniref:Uncharacterized protein n=1 Tax=Fimbriiglobus ruber TaxID=1908690 RepID=A0A225D0M5_9BACT|nr:hypothetical protein [Fimbriiglobus ruber]OWK35150.1 hypothetical protein FRUB_09992 [Fimbriiglobus ruber]
MLLAFGIFGLDFITSCKLVALLMLWGMSYLVYKAATSGAAQKAGANWLVGFFK